MRLAERIVNGFVKTLLRLVCKLDIGELRRIARRGPVILITNHTTNIEGPAIYVLLQPRKATALGKIELWHNPITRMFMKAWNVIPVHRGRVDSKALKLAIKALEDGALLGVAPEGTRSKTGKLRQAGRGAAMLGLRTGAPIYPVSQMGFRDLLPNLKRLRRTPVKIRVGEPFTVRIPEGKSASTATLREVADEMMYRIAELLPASERGYYADLSARTDAYLVPLGQN